MSYRISVPWVQPRNHGFEWHVEDAKCTINVDRVASIDGRGILRVFPKLVGQTDNEAIRNGVEIYVSPGGRSIRVWETKTGKELT